MVTLCVADARKYIIIWFFYKNSQFQPPRSAKTEDIATAYLMRVDCTRSTEFLSHRLKRREAAALMLREEKMKVKAPDNDSAQY
mmetsp:Transcript_19229/g.40424  ORF Transcript_19229/g.40424 Transcript_19229/m.40424 type:complete len:84 (+) Transcript_19229:249-500(+)